MKEVLVKKVLVKKFLVLVYPLDVKETLPVTLQRTLTTSKELSKHNLH